MSKSITRRMREAARNPALSPANADGDTDPAKYLANRAAAYIERMGGGDPLVACGFQLDAVFHALKHLRDVEGLTLPTEATSALTVWESVKADFPKPGS